MGNSTNANQGWLGKQQNAFAKFSTNCASDTGSTYFECVLEYYFNNPNTTIPTPNWSDVVEDLVYTGYNWQAYGNMSSNTRQPWAKDKSFLMAGTWLINAVVLNDMNDELYYQVCMSPNSPQSDGDDGSWCVDSKGDTIKVPDVLPVTFTSLAENDTSLIAPAFIGTQDNLYNLQYSEAYEFYGSTKSNTLQSGGNKTDNIPVMWASAASSAAAGYTSSYNVISSDCAHWSCPYHARNLALGFKIPNNTNQVEFVPDATMDKINLDDLNTDRAFRIADGGAIDNSGIIQLIGYLQLNKIDNNFNIVAFDDIQSNDAIDTIIYPSSDISYLFHGAPSDSVCVQGVCVGVPQLTIVKPNPSSSNPISKHSWTVVDQNNNPTADSLHYYTYEVQTVANPSFNINGTSTGTIHVFASEFGCADTAPENQNDFPCYNDMLKNFGPTLSKKPNNGTSTKTGYTLLAEAFGL